MPTIYVGAREVMLNQARPRWEVLMGVCVAILLRAELMAPVLVCFVWFSHPPEQRHSLPNEESGETERNSEHEDEMIVLQPVCAPGSRNNRAHRAFAVPAHRVCLSQELRSTVRSFVRETLLAASLQQKVVALSFDV